MAFFLGLLGIGLAIFLIALYVGVIISLPVLGLYLLGILLVFLILFVAKKTLVNTDSSLTYKQEMKLYQVKQEENANREYNRQKEAELLDEQFQRVQAQIAQTRSELAEKESALAAVKQELRDMGLTEEALWNTQVIDKVADAIQNGRAATIADAYHLFERGDLR